jgi:hypothetical protein
LTDSIDLVLGEHILPKPNGNQWNICTWKSINIGTVGVVETDNYPSLRIFPNPTTGQLTILNIEIFDIVGKKVLQLLVYFSGNFMFCISDILKILKYKNTLFFHSSIISGLFFFVRSMAVCSFQSVISFSFPDNNTSGTVCSLKLYGRV